MPKSNDSLQLCEEAFERLCDNKARLPEHVDIKPQNITSAAVSHEAGFDRGYLKKSREAHQPLIARIEARRKENKTDSNQSQTISRLKKKQEKTLSEMEVMRIKLEQALTQNLQLSFRVKELEDQLEKYQPKLDYIGN